jgi:hypothetical protein
MALRPAEIEKAAVWVLATITAALVFFQVHVDFLGATINLNFADPFAILALAAVAAHAVMTRHPPAWRVSHANLALIAISALLVLGFLRGTQQIGVTQWALTARLLGWLVLLGYLCAGYLMSANAGAHGRRRLFETMMATGAVIVVLQVLLRWLAQSNILTGLPPCGRRSTSLRSERGRRIGGNQAGPVPRSAESSAHQAHGGIRSCCRSSWQGCSSQRRVQA